MSIKLGRSRIERLMKDVIEKYKKDTGEELNATQTPSNYTGLANKLSERAKELHEKDKNSFPADDYIITPTQIRNAYYAQVDYLKEYFYESCHLYLYDKLSKDCKKEPDDLAINPRQSSVGEIDYKKRLTIVLTALFIMLAGLFFTSFKWYNVNTELSTLKEDMHIVRYKPTQAEIDKMEGVWEIYTASPQVRLSGDHGHRKTVSNLMEVKYKNGYFTFRRSGPTFSQHGYIQFEAPGLISLHSYYNNDKAFAISPKHTLMKLEPGKTYLNAISASWSFDPIPSDDIIIGIREVFTKLGKGGTVKVIRDARENALFPGMGIVHWVHDDNKADTLFQKIQLLDSLPPAIQYLLDENSILLKDPDPARLPTETQKLSRVAD